MIRDDTKMDSYTPDASIYIYYIYTHNLIVLNKYATSLTSGLSLSLFRCRLNILIFVVRYNRMCTAYNVRT